MKSDGLLVDQSKGEKVKTALFDYVREEKPDGLDWHKVTSEVNFSRILCAICDLDERFSYELDREVDYFKEYEKTYKNCPTEYGKVTIEKNKNNTIYVSFADEPCLTKIEERR